MKLGDRDDVATLDLDGTVYGGAGNDRITGSGRLSGGPGSDELIATGETAFSDDDGAQPAPDRYSAVPRRPTASPTRDARRPSSWTSRRSENAGDEFTSIEGVEGGEGDDRLIGTTGPNRLSGGPGADRLNGLDGD